MSHIKDLNKLSQPEFAALLGVSTLTIQRNARLEALRHGSGVGCFYVWAEFWQASGVDLSQLGEVQEITDRGRKDRADADMAEMEAAKMAGELMDKAEAVSTWSSALGRLRSNLLGLGGRLAPRLVDGLVEAERKDLVDREVRASLRELAEEASTLAAEEGAP